MDSEYTYMTHFFIFHTAYIFANINEFAKKAYKDGITRSVFNPIRNEMNSIIRSASISVGLLNFIFNLNNFTKKEKSLSSIPIKPGANISPTIKP